MSRTEIYFRTTFVNDAKQIWAELRDEWVVDGKKEMVTVARATTGLLSDCAATERRAAENLLEAIDDLRKRAVELMRAQHLIAEK